MGQSHGCRHSDHVTAEQRELHARTALGDTVAHGRDAARILRGGPHGLSRRLDGFGEPLQRLMSREHVIIGRDDGDIGRVGIAQPLFRTVGFCGKGMGPIGARELGAARAGLGGRSHAGQIVGAAVATALDDAGRNGGGDRVHGSFPS